jgi:hypothetical protein
MIQKLNSTYKTARYGACTYSLILDKRHPKANKDTYPVSMRYTIDRKSLYNCIAGELTEDEFDKICLLSARAVRSELYDKKVELDTIFQSQTSMIERIGNNLTLERIKSVITGVDVIKDPSFIGVWEDIIYHLNNDNDGERCTTGESYQHALNSFKKILWNKPIVGFKIGKEEIEYWSNRMIHGVKDKNGDVIGMIADATRGIYLRNCRAVWNECTARGFLSNQEYPFSNILKKKLVSIPIGDTRKECYLSVAQMTELYNVFINKKYPETWKQGYAERAHYSLMLVN